MEEQLPSMSAQLHILKEEHDVSTLKVKPWEPKPKCDFTPLGRSYELAL